MSRKDAAIAAARHLTRFTPFRSIGREESCLFVVNGDIPVAPALDEAALFVSTATECVRTLAMDLAEEGKDDYRTWAALYLCEISYAVVVACTDAARREDGDHV